MKCYKEDKDCDDCGNCKDVKWYANVNGEVFKVEVSERDKYPHVFDTFQGAYFYE